MRNCYINSQDTSKLQLLQYHPEFGSALFALKNKPHTHTQPGKFPQSFGGRLHQLFPPLFQPNPRQDTVFISSRSPLKFRAVWSECSHTSAPAKPFPCLWERCGLHSSAASPSPGHPTATESPTITHSWAKPSPHALKFQA